MLSELNVGPFRISRRRGGGSSALRETVHPGLGLGLGYGFNLGLGLVEQGRELETEMELEPQGPYEMLDQESGFGSDFDPDSNREQDHQMQVRLLVLRERLRQALYS